MKIGILLSLRCTQNRYELVGENELHDLRHEIDGISAVAVKVNEGLAQRALKVDDEDLRVKVDDVPRDEPCRLREVQGVVREVNDVLLGVGEDGAETAGNGPDDAGDERGTRIEW